MGSRVNLKNSYFFGATLILLDTIIKRRMNAVTTEYKGDYMARHLFERKDLERILDNIKGKTLGEVDTKNVFTKTVTFTKITGIAGDVIEQSVLGLPADSEQKPDIVVDNVDTELKSTGLKRAKRGEFSINAKEPMSITAVSPDSIIYEEFDDSALWHKLENMLIVYYLYDSDKTVLAAEYARFPIQGYQFHEFSEEDKKVIQSDWEIVRDFIRMLNKDVDDPKSRYPEISKLRENMMFMDTAPKYPNPPRFRLKQSVVGAIAQKHFGKGFELLQGGNRFNTYEGLYRILRSFTSEHRGRSINDIASSLSLEMNRNKQGVVNKSIAERVLTAAFSAGSGRLRDIDTFAKIGTIPKTITMSAKGLMTEDTKLDAVDFAEWADMSIEFEDSSVFNYFMNHSLLFSVFQEPHANPALEDKVFLGFKRVCFDDDFIYQHVKKTWSKVRALVNGNNLTVTEKRNKYGKPRVNRAGTIVEEVNFPKAKDYVVFIRGTGSDSTNKTYILNGLTMYPQQFWIKGTVLIKMLSETDYI